MSAREHLVLIAYDISDAHDRNRVAEYLEGRMIRVQESLFEGWMSAKAGRRLALDAARMIDAADSLRLYIVPAGGVGRCAAWGFPPAPEAGGLLIV
jgi:CRISPR-associated endonuclease Cas2